MTEAQRGVAALVAACTLWGLSPLYWRLLNHVPPGELLAHRTLWSFVFFAGLMAAQGRLGAVRALLAGPARGRVAAAAVFITANWFLLILSVQWGMLTEASLGYYIFPLLAVAIGVAAFGERLRGPQALAIALAAAGVGVLTVGLGAAPWIALTMATTFALYGAIKKRLVAGPVASVTAEVTLLALPAAAWIALVHAGWVSEGRAGGWLGQGAGTTLLLLGSGPVTAVPLMLFTAASRRVSMATLGLGQYVNPTLQFLVAVAILAEPFTPWHMAAFALIWAAVAVYSTAGVVQDRAARRRRVSVGTSGTTEE
ncbi:MAG: EamA family transporter RarD [Gemmobacter sp.]